MARGEDLTGRTFGRLTVHEKIGKEWLVKCECGVYFQTPTNPLTAGRTKSCGCQRRENIALQGMVSNVKHGGKGTPEYNVWANLKGRCLNPNDKDYDHYGGRGISVDPRWQHSFEAFIADMGPRPGPEYSIDRKNVDGNYEPGNCRWATQVEQHNNRTNNVFYDFRGQRLNMQQLMAISVVSGDTIRKRLNMGWSVEDAVLLPGERGKRNDLL